MQFVDESFQLKKFIDLEQLNYSISGISRSPDDIVDRQYLTERTFPVIQPSSFLMKKYKCREISLGTYPTVFVTSKYLPLMHIARA